MPTTYIIDVQAFPGKNKTFVAKEIAIFNVDKLNNMITLLCKPPYSLNELEKEERRVVTWLSFNLHKLKWSEGNISIEDAIILMKRMLSAHDIIYTKGSEKSKYLSSVLNVHVTDLDKLSCPRLKDIPAIKTKRCPFHFIESHHCAQFNAIRIGYWLHEHIAATKNIKPTET